MSTSQRQLARKRLAASLFFALTVPVVSAQTNVTLTGHVPISVLSATRLGRVAAEEPIRLSLAVRLDDALLKETLDQIYGPLAPANRRFLTSTEFAQKFDLLSKREQLKQFARARGMAVIAEEDRPDSMVVRVSGSAGIIEQAFGVQLNRYRDATGQVFRAHESDPIVPASIQPHLSAIFGLTDFQGAFSPSLQGSPVAPTYGPLALSGTGPGGGLAPNDIKTVYELPTALTAGAGQTAAVFELAQFNPTDLAGYTSQFHLPNIPLTIISVDGFSSVCPPGSCVGLGMAEVDLDTELIAAVAPGLSQILVYDGPNTQQGAMDIYNQIATDNLAQVISTSWGEGESRVGSAMLQSENQVFQRMAIQGQSMFAASGDSGAYGAGGTLVYDPPAQPNLTSVGGTSLSGTLQAPVETAWSGSGGGLSSFWPLPTYQTGLAGVASQQFRNVPDVALNADPNSPYATYVNGIWLNFGGTSASAPLWAGFTALVNQQRVTAGMSLLGFANPTLYQLAESSQYDNLYRDTTSGNNGTYSAVPGYDDVTGWGSYLGAPLLYALSGATSATSIFSPAVGQYLVGPVAISGSAFDPDFANYRVEYGEGANPTVFHLIGSVHNTPVTFGVLETWNTAALPTDVYTLRLTVTYASSQTKTATTAPIYVDNTPPAAPAQTTLAAPSPVSLTLSWTASTDPIGVAGYFLDLSTSAQFTSYVSGYWNFDAKNVTSLTINSVTPSTTYYARVRAYDGLGNISQYGPVAQVTTPTPVVPPPVPGQAVYDPVLMTPACHLTGNTCDSASLLIGRANLAGGGAEPNQPNTLFNSCADGTSGTFHASESNDHLTVSTPNGQPFAPGATVRVDATVWANVNFGSDWLDLYYAPNAYSPAWTLMGTLKARAAGSQVLSMQYTLPAGSLQAVRAVFRNGGRPSACTTGIYDDHDDLAFAVGSTTSAPPTPVINSPANATGTVGSAFSYAITATNNPTNFNATGLPAGLNINTSTGVISGPPQSAGTSSITLSATNAGGTGTETLVLTINPGATPSPVITSPLTASGIDGSNFSYSITATNNPTSYNAVGLPSGLSINTSSGAISGIPASTGVFTVTLTASNAGGTGAASLKLTITAASPPSAPAAALTVTPLSGSGPLTVTGDGTDSTGGNLSYAWNFGDHSTGYGAVVTHTFTQPGTYAITLTVSNSLGTAHTRSLVVVTGN
jgi:kumamolisin